MSGSTEERAARGLFSTGIDLARDPDFTVQVRPKGGDVTTVMLTIDETFGVDRKEIAALIAALADGGVRITGIVIDPYAAAGKAVELKLTLATDGYELLRYSHRFAVASTDGCMPVVVAAPWATTLAPKIIQEVRTAISNRYGRIDSVIGDMSAEDLRALVRRQAGFVAFLRETCRSHCAGDIDARECMLALTMAAPIEM